MGVGTSVPRQMQCCQSGNGPAWKAEARLRSLRRFDPFTLRQMLRYAGRLRSLPRKQRVPDEGMGVGTSAKRHIEPSSSGKTWVFDAHIRRFESYRLRQYGRVAELVKGSGL